MSANADLTETLRASLRRMERTTSADNFFYLAHRDGLIERFRRYLRNPEFAPLHYQLIKNDAFHYLVISLRTGYVQLWDYELYLLLFDRQMTLVYTDYTDPIAALSYAKRRFTLRKLAFGSPADLFAYLEPRKSMIAQIAADLTAKQR